MGNTALNKVLISAALCCAAFSLTACGDGPAEAETTGAEQRAASAAPENPIERALLNEIRCARPAKAAFVMNGLLRRGLIALSPRDGGDGIGVFIPTEPMSFLGLDIVRLSGWQSGSDGAMPPFSRGPGTAPPEFFRMIIRATPDQLRAALSSRGIKESQLIANTLSGSTPYRQTPGPQIEEGEQDAIEHPQQGVTSIQCAASDHDFEEELEASLQE